jgi:hypothetical protein
MKLDDRDITCETDYTPLSNAELVEAIEQHVAIMYTSPIIDFDLEWIIGPARALLARAEAAEAEAEDAILVASDAAQREENAMHALSHFRARVAELEAQLASDAADENQWLDAYIESAAKDGATIKRLMARVAELESQLAAQGWRPVTEEPEPDQKVEIIIEATFDGYGRKGWTTGGFYFNADFPTGWRPLPPAPQEAE